VVLARECLEHSTSHRMIQRMFVPLMTRNHNTTCVHSPCDLCVNSCWWLWNMIELAGTAVAWSKLKHRSYNPLLDTVEDMVNTYLMSGTWSTKLRKAIKDCILSNVVTIRTFCTHASVGQNSENTTHTIHFSVLVWRWTIFCLPYTHNPSWNRLTQVLNSF
jgi:hypothetical protein